MVTPLPPPGAGSSLKERVPQTILTPGGMALTLPPSSSSIATPPPASSINEDPNCSDWDQFFQLITQFKEREGHCNVPLHHLESGKKLWVWLMVQIHYFKKEINFRKRTKDCARKQLLESLGVDWNPRLSLYDFAWYFNFVLLMKFKQREGHLKVTYRHVEDGQRLGHWICDNRAQKKAGILDSEKERRLNEIGFIWSTFEVNWNTMFRVLTQYKQREGHFRIRRGYVEDGQNLGNWICDHRKKRRAGILDSEKERRLNEIGFVWNPIYEGKWDTMIRALTQFKRREGHMRVTKGHVEDGQELRPWINFQRSQKKAETLSIGKERRLNEIGFVWNAKDGKWDTMYRALAQFKQREGHCNVSDQHIEYLDDGAVKDKLGAWLMNQRLYQGCGTLDAKTEKRLESLGVKWNFKLQDITEEHFDSNFDLLLAFKEREGHVRVPIRHQESGSDHLGAWLVNQRSLHRHGRLELDRQKWLEVAGVTWEKRETSC
jgi:hypothetical protein